MVTFDPADRISVAEALKHPWLSTYHNPDDEPDCVESFRWREVEGLETSDDFKRAIWDEIQDYRREVRGLNTSAAAFGLGLDQIEEETAADFKTNTTRSSSPTSPHKKEALMTTEISPPQAEVEPSKGESDSQRTLPPSESLLPPSQDNPRSIIVSRARTGRGERYYDDYTPSTAASVSTPADPTLAYARRSSSIYQQNPSIPHQKEGHLDESGSELPRTGNYSYTIGPGTVGKLLKTLSTVSIHESGRGLKGGLADIAPIGKFIIERGSDDELSANEVFNP